MFFTPDFKEGDEVVLLIDWGKYPVGTRATITYIPPDGGKYEVTFPWGDARVTITIRADQIGKVA